MGIELRRARDSCLPHAYRGGGGGSSGFSRTFVALLSIFLDDRYQRKYCCIIHRVCKQGDPVVDISRTIKYLQNRCFFALILGGYERCVCTKVQTPRACPPWETASNTRPSAPPPRLWPPKGQKRVLIVSLCDVMIGDHEDQTGAGVKSTTLLLRHNALASMCCAWKCSACILCIKCNTRLFLNENWSQRKSRTLDFTSNKKGVLNGNTRVKKRALWQCAWWLICKQFTWAPSEQFITDQNKQFTFLLVFAFFLLLPGRWLRWPVKGDQR